MEPEYMRRWGHGKISARGRWRDRMREIPDPLVPISAEGVFCRITSGLADAESFCGFGIHRGVWNDVKLSGNLIFQFPVDAWYFFCIFLFTFFIEVELDIEKKWEFIEFLNNECKVIEKNIGMTSSLKQTFMLINCLFFTSEQWFII